MLPRPVPFQNHFLGTEGRAGRGRMVVRLWLLGFRPTTAWDFAMAEDVDWREHLPVHYQGRLVDERLYGEHMRRRLREVEEASDPDGTSDGTRSPAT